MIQIKQTIAKKVFPATMLTLVSLLSFAPLALASDYVEKTYRTSGSYSGVHRCGSSEANARESRIIAERKVKDLMSQTDMRVKLVDFKYRASTRHWEDRDKLGFSKGRKCQTHLEVWVDARLYPDF
jgi:hypothetical protein